MNRLSINLIMKRVAAFVTMAAVALYSSAGVDGDFSVSVSAQASTGHFAPYMIGSWQGGRYVQRSSAIVDVGASIRVDTASRFAWGAGVEAIMQDAPSVDYSRYSLNDLSWGYTSLGSPLAYVQQLWAMAKYRGAYAIVGMKERDSRIVDGAVSSGDLVRSRNARPIPGLSAGFLDFQNIPFTNGWVQIDGEIFYGIFTDTEWGKKQFNYYNYLIAGDLWYIYRRCYFRTKPSMPLSVTVGMQAAGEFGGWTEYYYRGRVTRSDKRGFHLKDMLEMFLPLEGNDGTYYKGNSLGSWDFRADYRFANGRRLAMYFEWPFEDGSGIGRMNGWDGLWGVEYRPATSGGLLKTLVVEYLDFTNHSGPFHWTPIDHPGSSIGTMSSGGDNYYNNDVYGAYSNYGMSIGSPFLVSPVYNLDGFPGYAYNRTRGFHVALCGSLLPELDYKVMASGQWAWGNSRVPVAHSRRGLSAMVECGWRIDCLMKGLSMRAQVALDRGSLRGDNFGVMLSLTYTGGFGK